MTLIVLNNLLSSVLPSDMSKMSDGRMLLSEVVQSFEELSSEAKRSGFDLRICSAYRSFSDQKRIWDLKASGQRKLLDQNENELDFTKLNRDEVLTSILRWSAIPGASRHHWGTDFDVFDGRFITQDQLKLVQSEYRSNGPCAEFNQWLTELIKDGRSFGFERPYELDLGGVSPEPWHLSYRPLAEEFERQFDLTLFEELVSRLDISLIDLIKKDSAQIFQRYIGQYYLINKGT